MLIEMEMAPANEEPDPPLLTDSGTESFNDSPTADDSSTSATSTGHWDLSEYQHLIHIYCFITLCLSLKTPNNKYT